jgi:hypothetical protein
MQIPSSQFQHPDLTVQLEVKCNSLWPTMPTYHFLILDINIIAFASSRNNGSVGKKNKKLLLNIICA